MKMKNKKYNRSDSTEKSEIWSFKRVNRFKNIKQRLTRKNSKYNALLGLDKKGAGGKTFGQKLIQTFLNRDFIVCLSITAFVLIIFRVIATIPLPGVKINSKFNVSSSDFISIFNLLGGGGLSQVSMFAIGVSPYITAQIIMQLLSTDIVPPLSRLAKSGEIGRRKIELITRLLTLPFALIQSYGIVMLIQTQGRDVATFSSNTPAMISFYVLLMSAGTYLAMFMSDIISKRGVGNGVSLIIMSGILANLPGNFWQMFNRLLGVVPPSSNPLVGVLACALYVVFFLIMLLTVVFITLSTRKIPIQQTGEGLIKDPNDLPYLPIKVNNGGVIPVIFASSIMSIPITVVQFLPQSEGRWIVEDYFSLQTPVGVIIYGILVVLFVFLYSYIQINPEQIAKNFEKSHKFIPGIRSGYETEQHISRVLTRVNFFGAPFLAVIAVIPYVLSIVLHIPSSIGLGGTGIIIIVSVAIELWKAVHSLYTTTTYQMVHKNLVIANKDDTNYARKTTISDGNFGTDKETVSQLW